MKDLFFRTLKIRVSKRIKQPVSKEQITNVLVKVLAFSFLAFCALLFVACFVFVCITESNLGR